LSHFLDTRYPRTCTLECIPGSQRERGSAQNCESQRSCRWCDAASTFMVGFNGACRGVAGCPLASRIRFFVNSRQSAEASIPTAFLPSLSATTTVVPLPTKGSSTVPPRRHVARMGGSTNASGTQHRDSQESWSPPFEWSRHPSARCPPELSRRHSSPKSVAMGAFGSHPCRSMRLCFSQSERAARGQE